MNAELARLAPAVHNTMMSCYRYWQGLALSTTALWERSVQPAPVYAMCPLCTMEVRVDRVDLAQEHFLKCRGV